MRAGLALFLGCLLTATGNAQRNHSGYTADFWGTDRGLPDTTLTAILQAQSDFIWVGTEQGLARFDGLRFATYRRIEHPELPSDTITALCEDRSGRLWIGTENGLVSLWRGQFSRSELVRDAVTTLEEDAAGNLWIGTWRSGLFRRRDEAYESFAAHAALGGRSIRAVYCDSSGGVWIGTGPDPALFRYREGEFASIRRGALESSEINHIAEYPRGTIRIGTNRGLFTLAGDEIVRAPMREDLAGVAVAALHADPDGGLWIGGEALHRAFHADLSAVEEVAPTRAVSITAICRDREGNLWAGSTTEGLMRIREPKFRQFSFGARNNDNGIRTVTQALDGSVLVGQGAQGITRIDPQGRIHSLPARSLDNRDEVLAVLVTRDGTQLTGTRRELLITRDGVTTSHPEVGGARAIFEDREGVVWLGFQYAGIMQWRDGVFSSVTLPSPLADCSPQTFSETSDGDIYVGTWRHHVLRFSRGTLKVFDEEAGAPGRELRNVFVDRSDHLWVGSKGSGLGLLDGERLLFPSWTTEVFDSHILGMAQDDAGNLWLNTPRAIFMTPLEELVAAIRGEFPVSRLKLVNVTEGSGYAATDLQCFPHVLNDREGRIWFATKNRTIVVDPRTVRPNPVAPTVHIERVLANGRLLEATGGEIELAAGTRELLIEYTGLSFSAPGRVRFQHKLEGFDSDWVPGDWRFAYYTNLHPGRYRFQVIAGNGDGTWNNTGATIAFVQRPHLYETWWVWALATVALGAATAGAYRWRVAALERDKRRLEARISERTQELRLAKEQAEAATRAKTEFLESISHEIRNPLNGIVGLVGMLRESARDEDENTQARSLGACARSLSRLFDEVLGFSKVEHGQVAVQESPFGLGELIDDVVALFQIAARERGGEIVLRYEADRGDAYIGDEEKIGTIVGNFIGNAIKHAPGTCIEVVVQCHQVNEYGADVMVSVTDHGPGIPAAEQEAIFGKFVRGERAKRQRAPGTGLGLATCRALAELLGGHVLVESEPGHGATFVLTLRLKRDRTHVRVVGKPELRIAPATDWALVVEDQAYNQIVVRRVAEKLGFSVAVAGTATEARELFLKRPYAVVLLDWELPDANGDEVARFIRQHPAGAEVILVATTAHDQEDIRRQGVAAGIDAFAVKPLEVATVARMIARAREQRGGRGSSVPTGLDTRVFRLVGRGGPLEADAAAEHFDAILQAETAALASAVERGELGDAGKIAHRIKAHAGLVDAAGLRSAADQLHRAAQQGDADVVATLQRLLNVEAVALREQIRRWRHPTAVG